MQAAAAPFTPLHAKPSKRWTSLSPLPHGGQDFSATPQSHGGDAEVQLPGPSFSWNPQPAEEDSSEQGSNSGDDAPHVPELTDPNLGDCAHNCIICKRPAKALPYLLTHLLRLLFDACFRQRCRFEPKVIELRVVFVFTCNGDNVVNTYVELKALVSAEQWNPRV